MACFQPAHQSHRALFSAIGGDVLSLSKQKPCYCVLQCWEEMGSLLPSSGTGYMDNIIDLDQRLSLN